MKTDFKSYYIFLNLEPRTKLRSEILELSIISEISKDDNYLEIINSKTDETFAVNYFTTL